MRVPLPPALLTKPIAHRGYHNAAARIPENSLSAFEAAARAGYAIELDVQLTKDGQAVVFHDDTLDRLTAERGAVRDWTAATLGRIVLTNSDDPIPTLAQVLGLVAGRVPLLIEIKDTGDGLAATDGQLEAATAGVLARYNGLVALMSFNPSSVAHMARLAPGLPRGLTTDPFAQADWPGLSAHMAAELRGIVAYDATGSSFLSHNHADLGAARVAELKAQGADILCWTIRSPAQEAQARAIAQNVTFEGYAAPFPA